MTETLLLTKMWEHEGRCASIALMLGEKLVCDLPSNRMQGRLVDSSSKSVSTEVEEFKGASDVWYTDDGKRHAYVAGSQLISGEEGAHLYAANASVVELYGSRLTTPCVFTTDENLQFSFLRSKVKKKAAFLSDLPFYRANSRRNSDDSFSLAQALVPSSLRSRIQRTTDDEFSSTRVRAEDWLPFNRIGSEGEWRACLGAIRWMNDEASETELVISVGKSNVKSGLWLACSVGAPEKSFGMIGCVY